MKAFLLPHGVSDGAKALAEAMGIKRIKRTGSKFRPGFDKIVINWGNSLEGRLPPFMQAQSNWLNPPSAVGNAANKLDCWAMLHQAGVPTVTYTGDVYCIATWLLEGSDVVLRLTLNGSGGAGIHVLHSADYDKSLSIDTLAMQIDDTIRSLRSGRGAWVATRYFKARQEFRVHVMRGRAIDIQEKRKRSDVPRDQVNYYVRSYDNGFVFCRENVETPNLVIDASIAAVSALGLDFGAVDIRYNSTSGDVCVLEVNSAPGLEGTTVEKYSAAFAELIELLNV